MQATFAALPDDRKIKELDGVSPKVLTQHLRSMEAYGLVDRKVYAEVPPRVEYSLTELGRSLEPIHDAMWQWGKAYKAAQLASVFT